MASPQWRSTPTPRQRTHTHAVYTHPSVVQQPFFIRFNSDPDSVAFCVLATDEEYECDIALQIHFTLIQAFCCENDINIVRVSNMRRLAEILGESQPGGEPEDLHCVLVTVSQGRGHLHSATRRTCTMASCHGY